MDAFTPAVEVAAAVRRRQVSPVELLEGCLERVDRLNPAVNAVVWRNDEEARAEAKALADQIAKGTEELPPFAGVPLPVKDLTPVAGWPVTYGSCVAPEGPSDEGELVVEALRRAGFLLTARTNTPEFGPITVTENRRYGVSRNPWDTERTPGGSSGGAAAAVASGMFPLAHGNDGGGSLRVPASCCGLVGLKASRGRVPARVTGWMGCTVEGVITRTVTDAAAVLDVISGPDPACWFNTPPPDRPFVSEVGADPGRLRVGLLTRAPLDLPVADEPRRAVEAAGALLEGLGHHVEAVDFELFPVEILGPFLTIVNAGLADYVGIDFAKAEPHIAAQYEAAQAENSFALARAMGDLQRHTRTSVARWGRDFDVLVTPTMAIEPPIAGAVLEETHAGAGAPAADVVAMAVFNAPFNVTGQPGLSLPLHFTPSDIPIGVQLVAGPWQEGLLLRLAAQLEEAAPWAARRPPIH
ncbi:MAG TPA: amidase [Acidimicrobiales bacterium]|nr:amidase [Acidimicrobiales bacterium]